MLNDSRSVYGRAGRYAVLFAVPAIVEMIQHAAEIRLGFYGDWAAMKAAEGHPLRMVLGHLKVFTLFLTGYWAIRFWAFGDDPVAARTLDPRAVRLFVPVMA